MKWTVYALNGENEYEDKHGVTVDSKKQAVEKMEMLAQFHVHSWAMPTLTHKESVDVWYKQKCEGISGLYGISKPYDKAFHQVPVKIEMTDPKNGGTFKVYVDVWGEDAPMEE